MHTFTLNDADGKAHVYRVARHAGGVGWGLTCEIMALASGPLSTVLGALVGGGGSGAAIDLSQLAAALPGAIASLPKLTPRVFAHTTRDDKPLADPTEFDLAYQGNFWECSQALWEVVQHNRFLPLQAISKLASPRTQVGPEATNP